MNRFEYCKAQLVENESFVDKDKNIKLYNADDKTNFEDGEILLTTHRLLWGKPGEIARGMTTLSLKLKYVMAIDEETASSMLFSTKQRIILHLSQPASDNLPGPGAMGNANASFIKLSGRTGLKPAFVQALRETVSAKIWEVSTSCSNPEESPKIKLRNGIVGIERSLQEKQKLTDDNINLAFKDLNKLMGMAKEMVTISKTISTKIRERQGDISEDETIRFKSYLLSLGIDDPVTRDSFQSNTQYYKSLSDQVCEIILDPITEVGGMMSLADVYCRVNRARGLELISPEDLMNACKLLNGPITLRKFPSGAMVLQLDNHSDETVANETRDLVEERKFLSVEDLARILNVSLSLARERLLTAERNGKICRDESIEGLYFYPNLFLV